MAALDFPNAPTLNQVATLTNGFSYQWDGTVWIPAGTSPGQVAGGDLTGTYPNPQIAAEVIVDADINAAANILGTKLIDGAVTWPKLNLQSYARVTRANTVQSIANNTPVAIIFDTVNSNSGGMYSTGAPDRFTIQQNGVYLIGGAVEFDVSAGGLRRIVAIGTNNIGWWSASQENGPMAGAPRSVCVDTLLGCAAGTVLYLSTLQDSGAALNTRAASIVPSFWIARVA